MFSGAPISRVRIAVIALLCFHTLSCLGFAGDDNHEFWALTSFSFRLNDDWKMKIKEDFRFRDGEHFEQHNDLYFTYSGLCAPLLFGLGFKQVHKEDAADEWQRENRPYLDLTFKQDLFGLKFSNRHRLEYRDFENKKDVLRYRDRVKLAWPNDVFELPVQPYIADEINVQEESGYNRNRLYAGVVWDVNETLDVDFFFIHQKDKTTHGWDDVFITGLETFFSF